jgi:predicted NUDIX family NTP pyrophosphohydrolase
VAEREFEEELGTRAPTGDRLPLGELRQPGGKRVLAWGFHGDLDVSEVTSNSFEIEWPPRSGRKQSFAEVDRAAWFSVSEAQVRLLKGQLPFLERLVQVLRSQGRLDVP